MKERLQEFPHRPEIPVQKKKEQHPMAHGFEVFPGTPKKKGGFVISTSQTNQAIQMLGV